MSDEEVGEYFDAAFVSSYQKVGAFTVVGRARQGGNVASYFCTPDGQVIHAMAGPADAATFLREARWAVEAYKLARLEVGADGPQLKTFFRQEHTRRLRDADGQNARQKRVHRLLADNPLPGIEQVYRKVFERILGEKVSSAPVRVVSRGP